MNRFWFDLDGTLLDTFHIFEMAAEKDGFTIKTPPVKYGLACDPFTPPHDVQREWFLDLFSRWQWSRPIDSGVQLFIKHIALASGLPIKVVTSRRIVPGSVYASIKALEMVFPGINFEVIHVDGISKMVHSKRDKIIFEDRRATALDFASRGYIVFLRNTTYNDIHVSREVRYDRYDGYLQSFVINEAYRIDRSLPKTARVPFFITDAKKVVWNGGVAGSQAGIYRFDHWGELDKNRIIEYIVN